MIQELDAIENERVDDIPLLLAVIKQMGVIDIANQNLNQHGNWDGLGMGYVLAVWLAYLLSTGDHRKNRLQQWAAERQHTLLHSLDVEEINDLDFTDDRLGILLEKLSNDTIWERCEREVNKRIIKVYELDAEIVRVDTTTVSSYGQVTEDGLLQLGYSKDHRPDLGQIKVASLTLDPLGLPLVTLPVSGEQADDSLYLPVIETARQSLGKTQGLLYVGDAKMAALGIRSNLARHGERYLMPLPTSQVEGELLGQYLTAFAELPAAMRNVEVVEAVDEQGEAHLVAEGFTVMVNLTDSYIENGEEKRWSWCERRLIVFSPAYAQAEGQRFYNQIEKSEAALKQLVQRRRGYQYPQTEAELKAKVTEILTQQRCQRYLDVEIVAQSVSKTIRPYKNHPSRVETRQAFDLLITRQAENIAAAHRLLGWRAYGTNAPSDKLSLPKAVEVYRDAYLHEHGYSRLKGKPLSVTPMYLQKETQMTGLIRLLSLALRVLTLIEFVVRNRLVEEKGTLQGIYAGNPSRKTKTPRTETLLAVFKGITLTIIRLGEQEWVHLTPLTATQKRILHLLDLSEEVYSSLVPEFAKVVLKSAN